VTPLLLIHGTGGDRALWARVEPELAGEYRVIAYDRRGHGDNPAAPPPPRGAYDVHADDALAVLDAQAGAEPAWVVGWSAGGLVALALAMRAPERVRGIVLGEPPLHAPRFGTPRLLAAFVRMKALAALGRERAAARAFLRSVHPDGFDRLPPARQEALLGRAKTILAEIAAGTGQEWSEDALAGIACPSAFVVGGESPRVFGAITEHFAAVLRAPIVRVEQAGHFLPLEAPRACAAALRTAITVAVRARSARRAR
jgi:pimeloyl-ACP methyl ester carboxylesterase